MSFNTKIDAQVAFALHCMCSIMNEEAIPAVWDLILEKLEHKEAYIRKKAVMAVKRVIQVDNSRAEGLNFALKKVLCDRDPSVMGMQFTLTLGFTLL